MDIRSKLSIDGYSNHIHKTNIQIIIGITKISGGGWGAKSFFKKIFKNILPIDSYINLIGVLSPFNILVK